MSIIQIGVTGLICVILIISIRKENPQAAVLLSLAGGLLITFNAVGCLQIIITEIKELTRNIDVNFRYVSTVLKITGISYIAEFCSQLCIDAGESAIASKIELGAKIFIISASIPVVSGLVETVNLLLT